MFSEIRRLLHLFDIGLIDEAGLVRGLDCAARHPSRRAA